MNLNAVENDYFWVRSHASFLPLHTFFVHISLLEENVRIAQFVFTAK